MAVSRQGEMFQPTIVFDSYWRFAVERHSMFMRRLSNPVGPWTDDPVLRSYRFTNTYRVADRVSQYLIREVQYREDRSQAPAEVFFRTILFKLFNRIATWELLESRLGPLSWQSFDLEAASSVLDEAMASGRRIYSAAYIMPAPRFGQRRKHDNHLALLAMMMGDGAPAKVERSAGLSEVYSLLRSYAGLGSFLAFQYAVDLNYSSIIDFDEGSFVVAGPGAIDGIAKCFEDSGKLSPEQVILAVTDRQDEQFSRLGLEFEGLFGRRLQPIDCQNLFCEIGKYARVAHPEFAGVSGRTRIKQSYSVAGVLPEPAFPPSWNLRVPAGAAALPAQGALF